MSRFDSRLLFVIVSCGLLIIALSCSQTDNITASKSLTKVWLTAKQLPTPTPGMCYGLWVSKVAYPDISRTSQVRLLGQFSYIISDTLVAFLEPDNTVRTDSNEFRLEADLFDYSHMFVTIENIDSIGSLPGPVMLMQSVTGNSDTIRMYFPKLDSLFESIIRCNFESPTDGNRGYDGYGLWFCNYELIYREIHDTLGAEVTYGWQTIEPIIGGEGDTLNLVDLYRAYADEVWFEFDTSLLDFGRDTLALSIDTLAYKHYGARRCVCYGNIYDTVWDSSVVPPVIDTIIFIDSIPRIIKDFGGNNITLDTMVTPVLLDVFTQDGFDLPDLTPYRWKYKGWIVSDRIDTNAIGKFTPPAWDFISGELLIPGYQGGLLSTGTFSDELKADNSDPFTLEIDWEVDSVRSFFRSRDSVAVGPLPPYVCDPAADTVQYFERVVTDTVLKRPNFPGEDFLDLDALSAATHGVINSARYPDGFNLLPDFDNSRSGSVFVTIEPISMVSDTTNFPLIAFCRNLPAAWPVVPVGRGATWTLLNYTGTAAGADGFPTVTAEIERL